MNDDNFIIIQGWMINQLQLKGNELLVYAIIYGFTQDRETKYNGSLTYMADMVCCSKQTIITILKSLCEKQLITKEEFTSNNIKYCQYYANLNGSQKILPPVKNFEWGVVKKFDWGSQKILPNNNIYNNNNIEENNISKDIYKRNRFVKPTLKEVQAYCSERNNNVDAQAFIDFYESKGWLVGKTPMKDWKACVRTWERNDKKSNNKKSNTKPDEHKFDDYNLGEMFG